jgi:DNA invertase Pin-like site-specific DNA recombinase
MTPSKSPSLRLIGYARVSTDDQDLAMQVTALRRAGVMDVNLYTDQKSGATLARKGLEHALLDCRKGDVLVVWKLDRLSRSLKDLLSMSEKLAAEGVELRSLHENIDTTHPTGKLFFHVMAALAEFERGLIGWRTQQGMMAARERGAKFGPTPKMGDRETKLAIKMLKDGHKPMEVAAHFGVSGQLVRSKVLQRLGRPLWKKRKPSKKK